MLAVRFNRNLSLRAASFSTSCPFEILGLARDCTYDQVKKEFLRLAMRTHPDMVVTSATDKQTAEIRFVEIRAAFERIKPTENGQARVIDDFDRFHKKSGDNSNVATDEADDFDSWFYSETGSQPLTQIYLDHKAKREVRDFLKANPTPGGIDRGGMWHLARMVSEYSNDNSNREHVYRVESGKPIRNRRQKKR